MARTEYVIEALEIRDKLAEAISKINRSSNGYNREKVSISHARIIAEKLITDGLVDIPAIQELMVRDAENKLVASAEEPDEDSEEAEVELPAF